MRIYKLRSLYNYRLLLLALLLLVSVVSQARATVTDPNAIRFSNEFTRPAADALAQEYNRGVQLIAQWNALGGGAPATLVMAPALQKQARFMIENHHLFWRAENEWLGQGITLILTGGGQIMDGAGSGGDPSRPVITADQAITVVTRWRERTNWLTASTATWASTTPLSSGGANLNTVIACYYNPTATNCGNLINRLTELKTQYELTSSSRLNSILAVAVNPN